MIVEWREEVTYNAHALPCGNQGCNADEEANGGRGSPATASRTECEDDCAKEATNNATNTETTSKDNPRTIAIADCVADEIGMCLMAESPFDRIQNLTKRRRVCGDGQGTKEVRRLLVGEIKTTSPFAGYICGDDT